MKPKPPPHVDTWLSKCGLSDEPGVTAMIARTRPAELASCNSPTMDSGLLQIMANQIAYQFVYDDRAEDLGKRCPDRLLPMLCESISILRDGLPPSTPRSGSVRSPPAGP